MKKIEDAGDANEAVTVYFGPVEIRNFGQGEPGPSRLWRGESLANAAEAYPRAELQWKKSRRFGSY